MERNYEKFFTPDAVADQMVELSEIKDKMRILEPHAATGQIVRAILRTKKNVIIDCVEINFDYVVQMRDLDINSIHICNFLNFSTKQKYDRVIANPPFGNEINLPEHFWRMFELVDHGGILTSIVPADFEIENKIDLRKYQNMFQSTIEEMQIDNWCNNSDGTETKIKIVKIKK